LTVQPGDQQTQQQQSAAAPGGVNPGDQTQQQGQQQGQQQSQQPQSTGTQPYFVANTQEEFEARFGPVRVEGRTSVPKKLGFDTVEALEAFVAQAKLNGQDPQALALQQAQGQQGQQPAQQPPQQQQPTPQPAQQQQGTAQQNTDVASELVQIKLERTMERSALALGADPTKLDAVMAIAKSSSNLTASGAAPSDDAVRQSVEAVLAAHPYFKAAPTTIGSGTIPPAPETKTTDQLIAEATAAGNHQEVIRLQMSKMFTPAAATPPTT
jgi:hypothetical protein